MGSESIREGLLHNHIHIGNFSHCQTAHMSNVDDLTYNCICKAGQGDIEFSPCSNKNSFYFLVCKKPKQLRSVH